MKHSPIIASDFYADTETKLLAARRDSDLSECAALLDGFEFQELPEHKQLHLCTLYSEAYFRITGAFVA
jgi:hypothetical protein